MPRGRAKALNAEGDGFSQPSAPTKRRKKSRASPGTPDMIPPPMGNYGPMMPGNPMDDPRGYPPNSMPFSPNSMPDGPYSNHMGPMMGGPGQGRGGPMPGSQGPYPYPGGPGPGPGHPMNHRMPQPGQMSAMGPQSNGKVYPSSASMVFNPSNPNAPPIYPCGICHKEVHDNDQAILCESGCNFWYHRSCTGLTEIAFIMLTQEVYAEWACDHCLQSRSIPLVKMKS
ncbi:protein pygopus-like [Ruditapes philippinarum]|uniref:protein pygopus-like n=1 Tax=Ruditapes philippinarum TaxID=129788 RepID=UPI00295B173F|nr:protein pygopus-like [Ruditapes philippinarum]